MSRHLKNLLFVGCVLFAVSQAHGQDRVQISNGLKEPLRLWLKPRDQIDWSRPPVFLPRSGAVSLFLAYQSDYWIVVQDFAGDEDWIGWIDLPKLAKIVPPVELVVGGGYVTTVREMTRTVTVYETRQEKRKAIFCERVRVIGPNGRARYVWVEREVEITHSILIPVEKTENILIRVQSLKVDLSVNHNGMTIPIGEFLKQKKLEKKLP